MRISDWSSDVCSSDLEIFPAMQSGAVDAAEWVGPWNDLAFGLHQVAKYYYMPAFHEPGPGLEVVVNKARFEELPGDLKKIVEYAVGSVAHTTDGDFHYHNVVSLDPLEIGRASSRERGCQYG